MAKINTEVARPCFDTIDMDGYLLDSDEVQWIQQVYPHDRYRKFRLALAVTLRFFSYCQCYPSAQRHPPAFLINVLAKQLGCPDITLSNFNWHYSNTTMKRFKRLVRARLGYRIATTADIQRFIQWFMNTIATTAPTPIQSIAHSEAYFTQHQLERPSPERLRRHTNRAQAQFEQLFFECITNELPTASQLSFDKWLRNPTATNDHDIVSPIQLQDIKQELRELKPDKISDFINTLSALQNIALPMEFLETASRRLLFKYHQRIMVETSSEIAEHPKKYRYAMLAIFVYVQRPKMIDILGQSLSNSLHALKIKAETTIKRTILNDVARVKGKFDILYNLAKLSLETPDGIISNTIYPNVSQDTLSQLTEELKHQGNWYEQTVKTKMRAFYSHHHRRILLPILQALIFHPQHDDYNPIIEAIRFIQLHADSSKKKIEVTDNIVLQSVISKKWQSLVIEKKVQKEKTYTWVNRYYYELAVFEKLTALLDCKSIWIEGAGRYQNPDHDLPQDFEKRKIEYFSKLNLPLLADDYLGGIKAKMQEAMKIFHDKLKDNKKILITTKSNKPWIKISPSAPQVSPENIDSLKNELVTRWPGLNLLDILKETALRTNLTRHFHTVCDHEILKPSVLQKRLLLCLYGIGTNAGLKRISGGNYDINYQDLRYIKRRYLTPCRVRAAIKEVVDQTLQIRDPLIWPSVNVTVATDSKRINVWDQNLMSQWHARYKNSGVMVYWHVDKKSLCVYSQLKTCMSSEVASMLQGVLHHDTQMNIQRVTMDTHGQSLAGFALSNLLHVTLLPRIKGIQKEKLALPNPDFRSNVPEFSAILSDPIDWELIRDNYDELVKYAAALKQGLVDSEVILKRFKAGNYQHPVYKAMMELGRAIKTIFLCRYLHSKKLRIEIHESQNVVERVNGFIDFIFFGKLGEISTNRTLDQELAVLCLHLLQASLVYINTLLIQEVLSTPEWKDKLTNIDKRALTPLLHAHINPYGLFPLDMDARLNIELTTASNEEYYVQDIAEGARQTVC
ncbi:MAG: Tn3 family transposase [Gammaproteobacteria bacterium]|nr:Tn3 family transposase [Gammaproteobacteria bacterium]